MSKTQESGRSINYFLLVHDLDQQAWADAILVSRGIYLDPELRHDPAKLAEYMSELGQVVNRFKVTSNVGWMYEREYLAMDALSAFIQTENPADMKLKLQNLRESVLRIGGRMHIPESEGEFGKIVSFLITLVPETDELRQIVLQDEQAHNLSNMDAYRNTFFRNNPAVTDVPPSTSPSYQD